MPPLSIIVNPTYPTVSKLLDAFFILIIAAFLLGSSNCCAQAVYIQGGKFTPLYGLEPKQKSLKVKNFYIDRYPVTKAAFNLFIINNPQWSRSEISPLFSDSKYLSNLENNSNDTDVPITYVSWYAANQYCVDRSGRLPTVLEWEYVAAASEKMKNASRDPAFVQQLLDWYALPSDPNKLTKVGQRKPNYWGVYDMHGLVWEWTSDFNSVFVAGDNRREGEELKNLFCGPGALGSSDRANYAAFMRYAMRNSLKANYSTANLGFRCAYDKKID